MCEWKSNLKADISGGQNTDILLAITKLMSSPQEFRCEVCGTVSTSAKHWFVIQCGDSQLTVLRWNLETANAAGARHFCGEGHAQVYISRWFDSICSPPRPDFLGPASAQ